MRRVVCASPSYLAARGEPNEPSELADHDLIEMSGMATFGSVWSFGSARREMTVRVAPRLKVNQTDVAVAAALAGRGLTRLLSYQVAEYLRDGRLRAVLTDLEPPAMPISSSAGTPPTLCQSRSVRRVCIRTTSRTPVLAMSAYAPCPHVERGRQLLGTGRRHALLGRILFTGPQAICPIRECRVGRAFSRGPARVARAHALRTIGSLPAPCRPD